MEKKFKIGDIVYLQKLYTKEEWPDDWGVIDFTFDLNTPLEVIDYDKNEEAISFKGHGLWWYPSTFFDYQPFNSLKTEINKLKDAILNKRITVNKKDRKIFESICNRLNIEISQGSLKLTQKEYGISSDAEYRNDYNSSKIFYLEQSSSLNFKDLIEPFKKFKDEIL